MRIDPMLRERQCNRPHDIIWLSCDWPLRTILWLLSWP